MAMTTAAKMNGNSMLAQPDTIRGMRRLVSAAQNRAARATAGAMSGTALGSASPPTTVPATYTKTYPIEATRQLPPASGPDVYASTLLMNPVYLSVSTTMGGSYATAALNIGAAAGPAIGVVALSGSALGSVWVAVALTGIASFLLLPALRLIAPREPGLLGRVLA